MGEKPLKIRRGGVSLTAWNNEKGRSWVLEKSYKDKKTDEWKITKYYYDEELRKLKEVIDEALIFVEAEKGQQGPSEDGEDTPF